MSFHFNPLSLNTLSIIILKSQGRISYDLDIGMYGRCILLSIVKRADEGAIISRQVDCVLALDG